MGRAECEAWAREPIAPAQDGFGATQDSAHPDEIHLHIYGDYKYGIGLMVVVITNGMGLLNIGIASLQHPPLKKHDR